MDLLRIAVRIARLPWEQDAPKNKNGVTWDEWCAAAKRDPKKDSDYHVAWKQGEDPKKFMGTHTAATTGFNPEALRIEGEDPSEDVGPDGESNSRTIHGTYGGYKFSYFVEQDVNDRSVLVHEELVPESTDEFFFSPVGRDSTNELMGHLQGLVFP